MGSQIAVYGNLSNPPPAYTRPWTAVMPLRAMDDLLFEYACHEANYGMEGILRGARFRDKQSAKP
jgi:hypothetical protein